MKMVIRMTVPMPALGMEIKLARMQRRLSLREVGRMVGLSGQAILNVENGIGHLRNSLWIAKELGVPIHVVTCCMTNDVEHEAREMGLDE